jgi:hypothetical protein
MQFGEYLQKFMDLSYKGSIGIKKKQFKMDTKALVSLLGQII